MNKKPKTFIRLSLGMSYMLIAFFIVSGFFLHWLALKAL